MTIHVLVGSQVSDRCPLGYLLKMVSIFVKKTISPKYVVSAVFRSPHEMFLYTSIHFK